MKRILITAGLLLAGLVAMAQPTLQEKTHGLIPGNPNPMITTTFVDPGMSGEDITWDFSGLPQEKAFYGDVVDLGAIPPPAQIQNANTCLVEGDLQAFMTTSSESLKVQGLRTDGGRMVRVYDNPITKMVYPFAYGDVISSSTTGTQRYSNGYQLPIRIDYRVEGDAYGTLILPGTTLHDVLRVVTTHDVSYSLNANAPRHTVVTYRWYVKEHRFPVLSLIFQKLNDGRYIPLKGAYNPIVQMPEEEIVAQEKQVDTPKAELASIEVTPNPFKDKLNVAYTLKGTANVTIAMYNLKGALVRTLLQARKFEGKYSHTFTSQVQKLTTGVYIVRVEAAGQILSQQLIKVD